MPKKQNETATVMVFAIFTAKRAQSLWEMSRLSPAALARYMDAVPESRI